MDFTWTDGPRTIRFGRGALAGAPELLGTGYALVTTERARASAPEVEARAGRVHVIGGGFVDELAGGLLDEVDADLVVGLGGGRVVDTAKALAALLSGYAIDAAWYGLHHVCAQTLVRVGGAGHAPANAAVLPVTAAALRGRFPGPLAAQDAAAGQPVEELARRLRERAGLVGVRSTGVERARLPACARAAAGRAELDNTPPRASEAELLALFESAW